MKQSHQAFIGLLTGKAPFGGKKGHTISIFFEDVPFLVEITKFYVGGETYGLCFVGWNVLRKRKVRCSPVSEEMRRGECRSGGVANTSQGITRL